VEQWNAIFENGNSFTMHDPDEEVWFTSGFSSGTNPNGYPDDDLKVVLGQVTTQSSVGVCITATVFQNGEIDAPLDITLCGSTEGITGCTDPAACNYSIFNCTDDGSCEGDAACFDEGATNYNPDESCANVYCMYLGCTDSTAYNYDSVATEDDGSCIYGCPYNAIDLTMYDAFGDGWSGASWTLFDLENNIVDNGTLQSGISGTDSLCVIDGCYSFVVSSGSFPSEITWSLAFGEELIEGGAPDEVVFAFGSDCIIGCADPGACNYIENVDMNFGCDYSCIGCTDTGACNFELDNTIDDGSCFYEAVIEGFVYYDTDQNGDYQSSGFVEYGMNLQAVVIEELGMTAYTNADGFYQFFNVPVGAYTVTLISDEAIWTMTTPASVAVTTTTCLVSNINFGLAAADTSPFQVSGPCCIFSMNIHCENGFNPGLFINNLGTQELNGQISITYDPVLEAEPIGSTVIPPDEINPGELIWNLDNSPLPGQSKIYQAHIIGPGVDYIGQTFEFVISLSLVDDEGLEYYNGSWVLDPIVVCSYDPNDKYTAYPGYTEANHFVLAEDEIEYRIRFQNEGNWAAQDVVIKDTLDVTKLDMSSFYPVFGSHSFMTCVNENGALDFSFENINLPFADEDEPASQGYVVYRIKPLSGVQPGDVVNNTAYIYFDNNPAIVTNTTWHTIYECGSESQFELNETEFCPGDELTATATHNYVDEFEWSQDSIVLSNDDIWTNTLGITGDFEITLSASNELCAANSVTQTYTVYELPDASVTINGDVLTASDGQAWQWYLDGDPIASADEQTWTATSPGLYSVEITNEWGCSTFSDKIVIIGIDEPNAPSLSLYPHPLVDQSILQLGTSGGLIKIYDSSGKLVLERTTNNSSFILHREDLSQGVYQLQVQSQKGVRHISLLVQ
jgi:uncharacterized repeat protein (TIGR01451 family)